MLRELCEMPLVQSCAARDAWSHSPFVRQMRFLRASEPVWSLDRQTIYCRSLRSSLALWARTSLMDIARGSICGGAASVCAIAPDGSPVKIGRASCRERVGQDV